MAPSVIDANCMKYFQDERLSGIEGIYHSMIDVTFRKGVLAIDSEGRALHEYGECCRPGSSGLNLKDWISDEIVAGRIRSFDLDHCLNRPLRQLGVPSSDLKWPAIAKSADADVIISEDIDLFEPSAKGRNGAARRSILLNGGCVSRFLKKDHGISVSIASEFVRVWG